MKTCFWGNGQFGPNLRQNRGTLYLIICSNIRIFLGHCGIMEQNRQTCISQFSQKIPFSDKRTIWAQFTPKLFNLMSHDLPQIFFNILASWDTICRERQHFPQKSSFSAIGQFGRKLSNLMSQAIKSHDMLFKKFEIFYYDGIQYLDQSNVCQLTQKSPSTQR